MTIDEEVRRLNERQADPRFHPLTCGRDSRHGVLTATVEKGDQIVLRCPDCSYEQVLSRRDFRARQFLEELQ